MTRPLTGAPYSGSAWCWRSAPHAVGQIPSSDSAQLSQNLFCSFKSWQLIRWYHSLGCPYRRHSVAVVLHKLISCDNCRPPLCGPLVYVFVFLGVCFLKCGGCYGCCLCTELASLQHHLCNLQPGFQLYHMFSRRPFLKCATPIHTSPLLWFSGSLCCRATLYVMHKRRALAGYTWAYAAQA